MSKKFSELTEGQKRQVSVMYSDKTPLDQFVYLFDDNGNYHGRKPVAEVEEDRTFSDVVEDVKEAVAGKKSTRTRKAKK